MTATVTILGRATDAHGRRAVLAKRWTRQPPGSGEAQQGAPRWTEQPYDRAYRYDARVESVAHIGELAELLARLAHDRHACVVRGELTGKRVGIRRRHKRRQGDKEADVPPLREAPTAVLALDLDHVPLPEHVDPRVDLDGCVEAGMALLPEAFHEVACAVQFTGGHGMPGKPGARMRLWVMLSRPMGGTEIRRWLRPEIDAGKIDGALYSASQPHYTAAPIFDSFDGTALPDHLAKRVLLRRGFTDEVQAPAEEELKPQRECGNYKAGPGEFTGGFEAIIARIGDHEGGAGYFRPINAAVGRWIRDNGHDADPKPLKAQLAGIITERGERDGRPQEYVQKRIADLDTLVEYVQQAERAKIDGTPCEPHWKAPARDNAATLARMASSMQQFFYNAARRATARQAFDAAKQEIEIAVGEMPEGGRWARRELRRRGREIRAEHGPWRTPGDRLQVVGAAGCGKTATAISLVVTTGATLGLVWICLPTWAEATRVTEEIIARGGGAISYRGRGAPKHGTNPVDSDLMCERPAAAKALGEAGMAVSKHLCKNPDTGESCPHFSTCAWQSQRLRADAIVKRGRGVIVGTFEMLAGNMGLGSPDLVVVDERAWDRLVGEVTLSVADMLPGMMAWRRRGKRGGDKLGQALDVRRELGAIRDAVTAGSGKILCELRARGFTSKQSFADTLEWLHGTEEEAAASITPGMADDDIAEQAKALQRSPWPAVHRLVRSLAAEIELPRDICHAVHTRQGENDPLAGHAVVHYVPRLGGIAERTPVLLLDASADLTINRRLFGERLH